MIGLLPYISIPMFQFPMEMAHVKSNACRIEDPIWESLYYSRPVVVFNQLHKPHLGYLHRSYNLVNAMTDYIIIPPFNSKVYFSNGKNILFNQGLYTFHVDLTTDNIVDFGDEMSAYIQRQQDNGN